MTINVLYVEDDKMCFDIVRLALTRAGMTVVPAYTAADGLRLCAGYEFDVILVDIGLPNGMDGHDFAVMLRGLGGPVAPLVAVTAYSDVATRERCGKEGFSEFLAKPYHIRDLVAVVERLAEIAFQ